MRFAIMMTLGALAMGFTARNAEAQDTYNRRHCRKCIQRTGYKWVQRETIENRKVFTGNRREFAGYKKELAGYEKVVSHYKWEWKLVQQHGRGYLYRVWKKVQVPVYKSVPRYRSVPTYRQVPQYTHKRISTLKWVKVPVLYYECR